MAHVITYVVNSSRLIEHEVEANDFEDARAVSPIADISVLAVGELCHQFGSDSGLLADFPKGSFWGFLTRVQGAFGETKCHFSDTFCHGFGSRILPVIGLDDGNPPRTGLAAYHHA